MKRLYGFLAIYRAYSQIHPRMYAARIAYGIVFRGLPF